MTYNPAIGKAVQRLRKHLPETPNVVELGSQTLTFKIPNHDLKTPADFYALLGFREYDSIDTDGKGTISADLNAVLTLKQRDLVTNNGTGEHIFNQAAVFETMHNLCKPGGIMLHVLPWINWRNHGFYNFHPILFYDLAHENGYELIECSRCDRNGEGLENVGFEEMKKPDATDVNWFVVAALKKTSAAPFKVPTQRKYRKESVVVEAPTFDILKNVTMHTAPFPHVTGSIDPALYKQLEAEWPKDNKLFLGTIKGQNTLRQINAALGLKQDVYSPLWRAFIEHHTSKAFFQELLKLFLPHIHKAYPDLKKLPLEVGLRGLDKKPFALDCQLAINTPVTKKSRVRGSHIDSPTQLIGGMLYMPAEGDKAGGNLQLGKWKGKPKFMARKGMLRMSEADAKSVKLTKTIAYAPNTLIFFLNTPDAIHSVTERSPTKQVRRYVNFLVETKRPLFGYETRNVTVADVHKEWK